MLFADTTAPDDISKAIGNFLGPLFGNAGYRVGWILELTLSTIYLLFDVTAQVSMARKARGESAWKNPIKRVVSFSTTIFDLLLLKAMQLEEALVARNFNIENRQAKIKFTYRDILFILAVTLFSLALFKFT
jgi:energy-coupling factor transporter transmembrane protein EcfT